MWVDVENDVWWVDTCVVRHMRAFRLAYLGSKVHDSVNVLGFHNMGHQVSRLNITLDKLCMVLWTGW